MFAFQGDMLFLRVFDQVVIVLCSLSAIKDLLEKRGEIYADRRTPPILEMCAQRCYYAQPYVHVDDVGTTEPIGIGCCLTPGKVKPGVKEESY
jgi:hypothetical protein